MVRRFVVYFMHRPVLVVVSLMSSHFMVNIVDLVRKIMVWMSIKIVLVFYFMMLDVFVALIVTMVIFLWSHLVVYRIDGVGKLMIRVSVKVMLMVDHFAMDEVMTMVIVSIIVLICDIMINWSMSMGMIV